MKKGFTLIELLAVIVILAIIALIAIPSITNIVEEARKGAAKNSILGYIDAIEKQAAINLLNSDETDDIKAKTYDVSELTEKKVVVKGKVPTGTVTVNEKGEVTDYSLRINNYTVTPTDGNPNKPNAEKSSGNSAPPVKTYTVGETINYNPETNALCESPVSTPGTKTGCMKWYVIKNNGNSVDVILDHNTTATVAYETSGTYKEYAQASIKTQVDTDTASWTSGLNPRLITAEEVASITNTTTFDGSTGTWFFLNGSGDKKQTQVSTSQGTNEYAWLFDYTRDCTLYGCNIEDSSTYGYWTSSPGTVSSNFAWLVFSFGRLYDRKVDNGSDFGVRPVITIQKSALN